MKKTIAMLLVLVMVLSLGLSGCGNKPAENTNTGGNSNGSSNNINDAPEPEPEPESEPPETVESLLKNYSDKVDSGTGVIYNTEFVLKMSMEVFGESQAMEISGKLKTEAKGDISHVTGTMTYQQDGETDNAEIDSWTVKSGDKTTTYTKNNGTWYKQDSDLNTYIDSFKAMVLTKDVFDLTLTETDKEYLLQGTAEIGSIIGMMEGLMESMGELGDFDAIDFSKIIPAKVLYRFDRASKDLTYCEMDLKECYQDLMEQLLKSLIDQFMGDDEDAEEGEDDPFAGLDFSSLFKINVEDFYAKTTDVKLDPDLKLELPEEAKNASEYVPNEEPEIPDGYAEYNVEEMSVYFPDDFEEEDAASYGYSGLFANDKAACTVLRENKADFGGAVKDLKGYAELLLKANANHSPGELTDVNGHPVFEYTFTNSDGTSYSYYTAAFESEKAFWVMQFFSFTQNYEQLKPLFADWLDMVSFNE